MSVLALSMLLSAYMYGSGCNTNQYIKSAGPMVTTTSGKVLGKYVKVFDTDIAAFLGIPYALPPVGENRFKKPIPKDHWEGIFEATELPNACMQFSNRNFSWIPQNATPSEDCLYLNVWAPSDSCSTLEGKLPVIVWIHGGGFYSGSSSMDVYDGSTFAAYAKAIVVSLNYRLGIFGFLANGEDEAPGNVGLYDQNLAMQWVKRNVEYFGGDDQSITLMGESAGAISVSLHMISPLSRNLFNRGVLQSGTAYNPQMVDSTIVNGVKTLQFAKAVGCTESNITEVIECIKSKDAMQLARAESIFTSQFPMFYIPTYGDEFLPLHPIDAINEGQLAQMEILIGDTKDETSIFMNYMMKDAFQLDSEPHLNLHAARIIMENLFKAVIEPNATTVFSHYFQEIPDTDSKRIVQAIINAFGDYVFYCPVQYLAEKAKTAFVYWLTFRSARDRTSEWVGVPHFYDVPFVFGVPIHNTRDYTPEDGKFSSDIIQKWISFARKGHPLARENGHHEYDWPPFKAGIPTAYELNPRSEKTLNFPRATDCEFWRQFFVVPEM